MKTIIVEASNGPRNWGKFLLGTLDDEWSRCSAVPGCEGDRPLLGRIGWGRNSILVFDLQTCEGAVFSHGGYARADLNKHGIWVCPLFEHFLEWLYTQDRAKVLALDLPPWIDLPDAPFRDGGYRREGELGALRVALDEKTAALVECDKHLGEATLALMSLTIEAEDLRKRLAAAERRATRWVESTP